MYTPRGHEGENWRAACVSLPVQKSDVPEGSRHSARQTHFWPRGVDVTTRGATHGRPVIDPSQVVGCDKQRAGTPNHAHGVPAPPLVTPNHAHGVLALPLVTPYELTNWPAVGSHVSRLLPTGLPIQ